MISLFGLVLFSLVVICVGAAAVAADHEKVASEHQNEGNEQRNSLPKPEKWEQENQQQREHAAQDHPQGMVHQFHQRYLIRTTTSVRVVPP